MNGSPVPEDPSGTWGTDPLSGHTGSFPGLAPPSGPPGGGRDVWATDPGEQAAVDRAQHGRARPPVLLFAAACLVPVLTLPLMLLDGWGWHVLGWAAATFGTAALLIVGTLEDTRRRASIWYLGNDDLLRALRVGAVVLALLAAAAHAWLFADWLSRSAVFAA